VKHKNALVKAEQLAKQYVSKVSWNRASSHLNFITDLGQKVKIAAEKIAVAQEAQVQREQAAQKPEQRNNILCCITTTSRYA